MKQFNKANTTCCLALSLLTVDFASAQQLPFVHAYKEHPFLYNPAAAGSMEQARAFADYHKQFDKIPFSPTTFLFAVDGKIYQTNHGIGGTIQMDRTHLLSNVKGGLSYSYKLDLDTAKQHRLVLGTGITIVRQQFDFNKASAYTSGDAGLLPENNTNAVFDAQFGFTYQYRQFHAAFAGLQLFNSKVYFRDEVSSDNNIYYSLNRHFVGSFSYNFYTGKSKEHKITPLYNFMLTKGGLLLNDMGIQYGYNNFLNLGLGTRMAFNKDSPKFIWASAGINISNCITVNYYLQTNISGKNYAYLGNTHEMAVQYKIPNIKRRR